MKVGAGAVTVAVAVGVAVTILMAVVVAVAVAVSVAKAAALSVTGNVSGSSCSSSSIGGSGSVRNSGRNPSTPGGRCGRRSSLMVILYFPNTARRQIDKCKCKKDRKRNGKRMDFSPVG